MGSQSTLLLLGVWVERFGTYRLLVLPYCFVLFFLEGWSLAACLSYVTLHKTLSPSYPMPNARPMSSGAKGRLEACSGTPETNQQGLALCFLPLPARTLPSQFQSSQTLMA